MRGRHRDFCPFLQELVGPQKMRSIVTNGVSWLEKCTLDQRSEVVGDPVGLRVRGLGKIKKAD